MYFRVVFVCPCYKSRNFSFVLHWVSNVFSSMLFVLPNRITTEFISFMFSFLNFRRNLYLFMNVYLIIDNF